MASSQFYSVCLAHESIRACRALLLTSPCPSSRSFLHSQAITAMAPKLRLPRLSFQSSSWHGPHGPNGFFCFSYRAFASVSSSPRTRKAAESKNPREEIRKLDEEIHRLERERRSVGKGKNAGLTGMGGKAVSGGRKRNAGGDYATKEPRNAKPARSNQNAKFEAASGSSWNANARAMARYAQEEEEEKEDDDTMVDDDDDDDDDIADEDDEELGEDFSSDAEMYMETTDAEKESKTEGSASLVSEKPSSVTSETPILDPIEAAGLAPEAPKDDVSIEGMQGTKHPWKEWNDFYDVLAQKNYFKDVPPSKSSMEGEGYLRFQASSHMKRAILEFSRERDDIIRFLTKKHIRTVVNVGCPSTDRKVVNACKRLRVLCEIPEDEVCQQCKLKTFCTRAFAAPSPDLVAETSDVARVVYSFALNASPNAESQVSYPIGVVKSACHLIDEIVQLSAYPKDPGLPALKARTPVKPLVVEKDDADNKHRPGDWTCPDCNFLNFSKNSECRECGTFRASAKQLEPGDWECPECTFVNFRRNRECRECLTSRPPGAGGEIGSGGDYNMMPGDWKCPECQFKNFRRNSSCRRCSTKRPKGLEPNDDEDYEPGDWKCPECNFRNFQRNKNCKDCGTLSPDQSKKDDRWGLKKASGAASDGWGSNRSMQSAEKDGDRTTGSGRIKHQEWKPDLNKEMSDDTDEDLEENADVVFGRNDDGKDMPRPKSKGFSKGAKGSSSSRGNAADEMTLSDFDISDLEDDLTKKSQKKGSKKKGKDVGADEDEEDDDDEDDDNDMIDELSEAEETTSIEASKRATPAAQGRSFSKKWDDTASDDEDLSEDDRIGTTRTAVKRPPPKSRTFPKRWDDSDDDDEEDEGFSDDEDDFGRSRGRGRGRGLSSRGGLRGGRDGGGTRGWRGSARGSYRGESFGSSRGGDRGRHGSNFLESSGDEEEFSSRGGGGRGGRGFTRGGGGGDRGRRGSRFTDSSGDEEEFSRGGGGRGGRGFTRGGGGGRGRGGGGFSRGGFERGESFSRGGARNRFESGGREGFRGGYEGRRGGGFESGRGGGFESDRGGSFEGGRGSFGSRGRGGGGRRGRGGGRRGRS